MDGGKSLVSYFNEIGEKVGNDVYAAIVEIVCVALVCLGFEDRRHPKSKKTYGDRWKIGLLVLREYMNLSYREFCLHLPSVPGVLGGRKPPHDSTLRKFVKRLPDGLLDSVLGMLSLLLVYPDSTIAVDATGMCKSNASRHFVERLTHMGVKITAVKDFAKVTLAVEVKSQAVVAAVVSPSREADIRHFLPVLGKVADTGVAPAAVVADKGYDAEYAHTGAREILGTGVKTVIPVRNTKTPKSGASAGKCRPGGTYRKKTYENFDSHTYSGRPIAETVNSRLKRRMGDTVYGKSQETILAEVFFTLIAYNARLIIDRKLVKL